MLEDSDTPSPQPRKKNLKTQTLKPYCYVLKVKK